MRDSSCPPVDKIDSALVWSDPAFLANPPRQSGTGPHPHALALSPRHGAPAALIGQWRRRVVCSGRQQL